MQIELTPEAKTHLQYWQDQNNKAILQKIQQLLNSILENPFKGIGKPEALKHQLAGKWSRRINKEHRFVYAIKDTPVHIFPQRAFISKAPDSARPSKLKRGPGLVTWAIIWILPIRLMTTLPRIKRLENK